MIKSNIFNEHSISTKYTFFGNKKEDEEKNKHETKEDKNGFNSNFRLPMLTADGWLMAVIEEF